MVSTFGLRHRKTIAFLVAVLAALGVWAYMNTPAGIFPAMSFARIDVVADAGDLPPDQVRLTIAQPLAHVFLGLPSVTSVRATSAQGSAELFVNFDPKSDVRFDLQYVNAAIQQVRGSLPQSTSVQAVIVAPNTEPVLSYAFVAKGISQTVLRELIVQNVIPRFYGIPGLARVLTVGGERREYHVQLNPVALAAHGLTPKDVEAAIADANTVNALGVQQSFYQRNVLVLDSAIRTAADIGNTVVTDANKNPVAIRDLGVVNVGVAPPTSQMSYAAQHAVALNFFALPGADQVRMADAVKARMDALASRLPAGVTVSRYWDQTDLIVDSQRSLRDAILLGALLAILVIWFFLRDWRMTLVAALIIPIAMAISIFAMHVFGQTLNLMSVGGLAVAVGLIIDDAIVVVENIARHRRESPEASTSEIIQLSVRELGAPMAASTLTTVVVFVPLILLSGVSGFFFRALASTLASALLVSLALALFVAPSIASLLLGRGHAEKEDRGLVARALHAYEPLLRSALSHRALVYGASAVVLIVTVLLLTRLPSDFLPKLDEGQFEVTYTMPVGTTLAASDAAATAMERIALADPAVLTVGRFTGIDTNGYSPTQARTGTIRIRLKPQNQRPGYEEVSSRLRDAFSGAVPAAQLDFHQILEDMINDLSGSPAPLELTLYGPDQSTLIRVATELADRIGKVRNVADTFSGVQYDDPTLRIAPDRARLSTLGVAGADVGSLLQSTTQGSVATDVASTAMMIPVRVEMLGSGALVPTSSGAVPLSTLANIRSGGLSTDVTEENGERAMLITANVAGGSLSAAIAGVQHVLATTPLPPGYRVTIGGAYQAQQQSFREFISVIAIAVLLVFFVMLVAFRSFRLPLVILTAIPLALIGVALALFITRTPFNVSSFMGILLLVGIVVKNGILLMDAANRRREAGDPVNDALVTAGRMRLRPIVMTTFAAIGGLLPLALGLGAGSAMERPLAIAVIGGLSTATA
ncbi:MAG: efflux RND transporter permease subunit, partial [Candidatus Eremiobacteraeota bacterium]|nr:efflux RND transporter permease subunit [Candidatus Eremiobacteraeota bacterium]